MSNFTGQSKHASGRSARTPSVLHDLPRFFAPESHVVTPAVTKLGASLAKGRLKVEWEQPGSSSARNYALRVLREDSRLVSSPELQVLSGRENECTVSFDGRPFAYGETITLVVQLASPPGNFTPHASQGRGWRCMWLFGCTAATVPSPITID